MSGMSPCGGFPGLPGRESSTKANFGHLAELRARKAASWMIFPGRCGGRWSASWGFAARNRRTALFFLHEARKRARRRSECPEWALVEDSRVAACTEWALVEDSRVAACTERALVEDSREGTRRHAKLGRGGSGASARQARAWCEAGQFTS